MGTSIRIVTVLLLLAMPGGHVSTVVCEMACLSDAPFSRAAVPNLAVRGATGCHESASQPLEDVSRAALRSVHTGCHDHATAPFVLATKCVRDVLPTSAPAASASREITSNATYGLQLRDHTPPGIDRAPVVTLRI